MASVPSAACLAAERELQAAYALAAAIQQRQPMSERAATALAFEVLEDLRSRGLDVTPVGDAANDAHVTEVVTPVKTVAQFLGEFSSADAAVSKPLARLLRIATRQPTREDLEEMGAGASAWIQRGMPGHCANSMGLPRALASYGAEARNVALLAYAYEANYIKRLDESATQWDTVGRKVAADWDEFLKSDLWPRWKGEGGPSILGDKQPRRLLFWASIFNADSEALGYAQIRNVLKNVAGSSSA